MAIEEEEPKSKEQRDKENRAGCLVALGIIAALIVIGIAWNMVSATWSAIFGEGGDDGGDVRVAITIDLNVNLSHDLVLAGSECDLSEYRVEIFDGSPNGDLLGYADLGKGSESGSFCRFNVNTRIDPAEIYAVKIYTFADDPNIVSKTVQHKDVVSTRSDGSERLDIKVRWYNQKDEE